MVNVVTRALDTLDSQFTPGCRSAEYTKYDVIHNFARILSK